MWIHTRRIICLEYSTDEGYCCSSLTNMLHHGLNRWSNNLIVGSLASFSSCPSLQAQQFWLDCVRSVRLSTLLKQWQKTIMWQSPAPQVISL
jgi:hypothetical protein